MKIQTALNLIDQLIAESEFRHQQFLNNCTSGDSDFYKSRENEHDENMQQYQELRDAIETQRIEH